MMTRTAGPFSVITKRPTEISRDDACTPPGKKQLLFCPFRGKIKAKKKAIWKVDVLNLRLKNEVDVLNLTGKAQVDVLNVLNFAYKIDRYCTLCKYTVHVHCIRTLYTYIVPYIITLLS